MDTPIETTAHPVESDEDKAFAGTREGQQEVYLELLAEGFSVTEAATAIGISRTTSWYWRQNPAFFKRCQAAIRASVPDLEAEAHRRALKGSDKLLIFLLQARDPEKYNLAQKVEHSGAVDIVSILSEARKRSGMV